MELRSSYGKTATVRAPSSYAARKARMAISPRLATRIFRNMGTFRAGVDTTQQTVRVSKTRKDNVAAAHVLSVSSLKGGVGKTTVTLGLTSAAFAKGLRTLVVDLDPQSDVSTGLDINLPGHLNVADVLENPKEKIVRQAIAPSGWTKGSQGKIDVMVGSPSAINF